MDMIIKSKIKQGILKLFFFNEDKEFYLSQIAKTIDTSRGTAQRELRKLEKIGILKSEKKSSLRYYFLNKQDPLFDEWRGLVHKTIGIETELRRMVRKMTGVRFAFIFGSYTKGDFNSGSDVDLFIIGNPDKHELAEGIKRMEKGIEREINYHVYGEDEFEKKIRSNSFLQNIIKKIIILTPNEEEFRKILR